LIMNWVIVAFVPIIATAVMILAMAFRPREEEDRPGSRRLRPNGSPRPGERPRQDSQGIEAFLEEIRRRQALREGRSLAQQPAPIISRELPETSVELAPPKPASPVPALTPPIRFQATVAIPPEVPVLAVAAVAQAPPEPFAAPIAAEFLQPVRVQPLPSTADRAAAQTRDQLLTLLRSDQGLRTAFLLREVLDAPLCKRRPRA
jgi:hypothetical protein